MPHCPSCDREVDGSFCPFDGTPLAHVGRGPAVLPEVGDEVDGRYRLIEQLGSGGMAIVYRASNETLGHDVALKVLRPRFGEDRRMVTRFAREARAASQIDHVNVVKVYDFGYSENGFYFLAMELLEGEPLRDVMNASKHLPIARALALLSQIADGMARAHELGVVHRDLKPENVMVLRRRARDHATIVDFGLSKLDDGEQAVTREGDVIGTPDYMAPEQWKGQTVDARADVYAFGILAYEILSGELPFGGDTVIAKLSHHMHTEPLELARHPGAKDLPSGMSELVMKCIAKDRIDRFPHMGRVKAELDRIAGAQRQERRDEDAKRPSPAPVATLFAPIEETTLGRRELMEEVVRLRRVRQHRLAEVTPGAFGGSMPSEVRALIAAIELAEARADALGEDVALADASLEEARRARRQKEAELRAALVEANLQLAVMRSGLPGNVTASGKVAETMDLSSAEISMEEEVVDAESARRMLARAERRLAEFNAQSDEAIDDADMRLAEAVAASASANAELGKHYEGLERLLYEVSPAAVLELAQIDQALHRYRARLEELDRAG